VSGETLNGDPVSDTDSHDTEVVDIEIQHCEGWNEIDPWLGVDITGTDNVIDGLSSAIDPDVWTSVAHFDNPTQVWTQTFSDAPLPAFNTLAEIEVGKIYWIFVTEDALLTFPLE
jgi:hypothetical protein